MRWLYVLLAFLLYACKTGSSLFSKKSLHDQYAQKLTDAGLFATAMGKQWQQAAQLALSSPQTITIPYKEMGYFPSAEPRARGLKFQAMRGQKLYFSIERNPISGFALYADIYDWNNGQPSLLLSPDSTQKSFTLDIDKDQQLLIRLQPELLTSGDYTLSISIGPQLSFPVSGNAHIGSFWGDSRDEGGRRHEGIDIFASKGTPAVAAANGVVTSVRENNLGGKVVFMRPTGKDYTLYYAHLDQQLVSAGQSVKTGDKLGLVGNTGNARTTPAHLHFGIYALGGAIDPLPFVNRDIKEPEDIKQDPSLLRIHLRLRSQTLLRSIDGVNASNIAANTVLEPLAVIPGGYFVRLPDNSSAQLASDQVHGLSTIQHLLIKRDGFLRDKPSASAGRIMEIKKGQRGAVLGYYKEFVFAQIERQEGWLLNSLLQ